MSTAAKPGACPQHAAVFNVQTRSCHPADLPASGAAAATGDVAGDVALESVGAIKGTLSGSGLVIRRKKREVNLSTYPPAVTHAVPIEGTWPRSTHLFQLLFLVGSVFDALQSEDQTVNT
jgi:hypothetical protein